MAAEADHVCDPDRLLDFELFQFREEISGLDSEIEQYLSSAEGRFEQWYADNERRNRNADDTGDDPG